MIVHHIINDVDLRLGGAQHVVRCLHLGLLNRGIDSRLVCFTHSVDEIPSALSFECSTPRSPKVFIRLNAYLKKNRAEGGVLHSHLFPANLYTGLSSVGARWLYPSVTTEHSTHNHRRESWVGKPVDKLIYARQNRIVCISQGVAGALGRWMPSVNKKIEIIPNGVLLAANSFERLVSDEKPSIILSVGRLDYPKNYELALRALAALGASDVEYWIAGAGPDELGLKQLCIELGIAKQVKFLGFVRDIPSLLNKADIFLMPSRWEGFGLAAVEAMNAGLPLVVSDVEGLREVVSKKSAFIVPGQNPEDYAEALRLLCSNPVLRQSMGQAAFEESLKYSADAMIDSYVRLYESLLASMQRT